MTAFDFAQWRGWTKAQGDALVGKVPTVVFGSNDEYLPGFWLEMQNAMAIGSFRCFSNALVDYHVLDTRSNVDVAMNFMIEVSDSNFESTFNDYMTDFEKVN